MLNIASKQHSDLENGVLRVHTLQIQRIVSIQNERILSGLGGQQENVHYENISKIRIFGPNSIFTALTEQTGTGLTTHTSRWGKNSKYLSRSVPGPI